MNQFSDLEGLAGLAQTVNIRGKDFEIYELEIMDIAKFTSKVQKKAREAVEKGNEELDVIGLIINNIDLCYDLVAYATKSPADLIRKSAKDGKLGSSVIVELATKAIEVNENLFLSLKKTLTTFGILKTSQKSDQNTPRKSLHKKENKVVSQRTQTL